MTKVKDTLLSLFWRLVFHVLLVINFVRFCLILLFGDLTVKVVPPPGPETAVQTLEENPGGEQVPSDVSTGASSTPGDPSPIHLPTMNGSSDIQTLFKSPDPVQDGQDTSASILPPEVTQHPADPPTTLENDPRNDLNHYPEAEACDADPSLAQSPGRESSQVPPGSPAESLQQLSPGSGNEPSNDELYSIVPCWELEDVTWEDSTCLTPSTSPSSPGTHVSLQVVERAEELLLKYQINEDQHLLQRAIHLLDHLVPLLSNRVLLTTSLYLQAHCRHFLFVPTQDVAHLDQCIGACQTALGLQGWGLIDRHTTLTLCGNAFGDRYESRNVIADLERGISSYQEALEELAENMGRPPLVVASLGGLLLERHERRGSDGDLNDAVRLLSEALSLLGVNHPDRPRFLNSLAHALVVRHKRQRNISDVDEAIVYYREVLSLELDSHLRPSWLNSLAVALLTRYEDKGGIADVEEAIAHCREGLALGLGIHPHRINLLSNLASALYNRYQKLGDISDLGDAIIHHRKALSHMADDHPLRSACLDNLGTALRTSYLQLGSFSDLEEAIVHHREALSLESSDDVMRPISLNSLGSDLSTRYERLGNISDLEDAITYHLEALSLQSSSHPLRPSTLNNLATALIARYDNLANISDLENAIFHYREVLSLLATSHPHRAESLNNLAITLDKRHERSGGISDLQQGISHLREALSICHSDEPARPMCMFNLAILLRNRYERMRDADDLNEAIRLYEKTLSLLPGSHPDRPATLESLGRALLTRARNKDTDIGIRHIEESISLLPNHSPARQLVLLNFLNYRHRMITDPTVLLDRSAELARMTPPEHTFYSRMTSFIAPILHDHHEAASKLLAAVGIDPDLTTADATLALLRKGSRSSASSARDRLRATCDWITWSEKFGRPPTLEMYGLMLEQLDLAVARGSTLDSRQDHISGEVIHQRARYMVPDAVTFAIQEGAIETAVEFFERGRSIILAQLSLLRTPSGLETVAPDLARRFDDLSWQVEHATFTEGKGLGDAQITHPFEDPISRSDRLRREWEKTLEEIRAVNGFEGFLRRPPFVDLQKAAAEGPVILINLSKWRSDAIIVTVQNPPALVPLPNATPDRVLSLIDLFEKVAKSKLGNDIRPPLQSLWEDVVEPIILVLQQTRGVAERSRIWWCPSSAVSTLPLHAAGDYPTGRRLPDLYISSYTPTLNALSRSRQERQLEKSGPPTFLLVGQSETPNLSPLPAVHEEVVRIKHRIPHATVLEDEQGTHDAVLSAMKEHQWIHLACHGKIKPTNPLESHFALQDSPLPVLEIMQSRLPHAQLAFLSCCHSASGDSIIPDEFFHLAAGLQFAGFKSIVGTMWAMDDGVGPKLADEFYRVLLRKGKGKHQYSAKALSDALKILRRERVPLHVWINFVHWGA